MPFVLKHRKTAEIYTCRQLNKYNIPFFGTKFWDDSLQAEDEAAALLQEQGTDDAEEWEIVEVEEHRLKLFNVKLANNGNRKIFMDDQGQITVTRQS